MRPSSSANKGPGTNAGQVSIALAPASHLDGRYPVFAEVVGGLDLLFGINALIDPARVKAKDEVGVGGSHSSAGTRSVLHGQSTSRAGADEGLLGSVGSGGTLREVTILDAGVLDELEGEHQHTS
jgi:hypothetical protein